MQVLFEDKEYTLDLDDIDLTQARYIYRQCGLTLKGLRDGATELNPEAMVALYWLMLSQSGTTVDMRKVNFKVMKFMEAVADASQLEAATELGLTVEELERYQLEALKQDVSLSEVLPARPENPTEPEAEATEAALPTT